MSGLSKEAADALALAVAEADRRRAAQDREIKAMQPDPVAALAAEGVAIPEGVEPIDCDDPDCWVCANILPTIECPPTLPLCDEHRAEVWARHAELVLRHVIPDDFQDAKPSQAHPKLAQWQPSNGGLYLFGPTGTGKSYDAAAMVKRAWVSMRKQTGYAPSVAWIVVPDFIERVLDSFGTNDKVDTKWRDADILVLDEIGMGDDRPFAIRKLYAVIERRSQRRKTQVTIVTSNSDLDALQIHLGDDRIPSRLDGMCAQVSYVGMPDRRSGQAPKLEGN